MRFMGQLSECGGIRIACAADEFESMVAFYVATFGAEVVHHEQSWASLGCPRHTHINIRAEDWYVPPVWPEQLPGHTETNALRVSRHRHGRRGGARQEIGRDGRAVRALRPRPEPVLVVLDPAAHPFDLLAS